MKIGIFFNKNQVGGAAVHALREELSDRGAEVVVFDSEDAIGAVDRLIVLGGDGTVLRAARRAAGEGIPLFGINYGHTGFLTEFEEKERGEVISLALSPCPDFIDRSMLEVELNGKKTVCLNECSLLRGVSSEEDNRIVRICVRFDGSDAGEIVADGIIVATPTGSTAYSLSAGGSIMMPSCNTFLLTPVCALSMKSRPIVYDAAATLSFTVPEGHDLLLYGDGKFIDRVSPNDTVYIRRADKCATFLTRDKNGYLRRITKKIN